MMSQREALRLDDRRFADAYLDALRFLHDNGARATLVTLAVGPRS
jgi:hypothetical protein